MRLPALAAQLQGFAHSTDNLAVGVSPRTENCWQKVWGGLIPTYESMFFKFVRRGECASFAHSTDNLDVGVSPRKVCVGKCLEAVSFWPTN